MLRALVNYEDTYLQCRRLLTLSKSICVVLVCLDSESVLSVFLLLMSTYVWAFTWIVCSCVNCVDNQWCFLVHNIIPQGFIILALLFSHTWISSSHLISLIHIHTFFCVCASVTHLSLFLSTYHCLLTPSSSQKPELDTDDFRGLFKVHTLNQYNYLKQAWMWSNSSVQTSADHAHYIWNSISRHETLFNSAFSSSVRLLSVFICE